MLPNPDTLNEFQHGKFVLSNLAARRARALAQGAVPLIEIESRHPLTIALAEIAAGKITPVMGESRPEIIIDPNESRLLDDIMSERGVLLPALEESDASLLGDIDELEAEIELADDDSLSLSDLGPGEDETMDGDSDQVTESDEISLSELGEEEAEAEDSLEE